MNMLKGIAHILCALLCIFIIFVTLKHGMGYGKGSVSFFLSLMLGAGLIVYPFAAFGMLLMYFVMLVFIIGFPVLGAYIGVQITGKDSIGAYLGFFGGGYIGIKLVMLPFSDRGTDGGKRNSE